ncbi:MAG: NAD(P)/FAD-dependent oxidoreductase [Comamonadaceae bacterium]|nr:MAG: NAD(P)/FAD-dependent oxidoreductase [Comamonadaceae bacterium]
MSSTTSHDVVVIGAGAAGLAAVREALAAGLSAAWLEANMFGGLILNVNELDGAVQGSGAELASTWMAEATEAGGEDLGAVALGLERDGEGWVVVSDAGRHAARCVIIASGAALRKLGVPGEAELEHKGVSHCADCDGPMFHGQDVVVVGGGDSALQSACTLAKYCAKVHLVHRRDAFTAQPHWQAAVRAAPNIEVHFNSVVSEVAGTEGVEGARINGDLVPCTGFFAFVGLAPATALLPPDLSLDERGAVRVSDDNRTELPGLFAAGIVRAGCGGALQDAIDDGMRAGRSAAARLGAMDNVWTWP